MSLVLTKPLAVFDLETTGTNVSSDRIISIGIIKLSPGHPEFSREYLVHPGIPIPPAATAIHKITDEMVRNKPSFKAISAELLDLFNGCDVGGFNIKKFDLPLLTQEFERAGTQGFQQGRKIVDSMIIYKKQERRDLSAAARFYLNREHTGAHAALSDAQVALEILKAQIEKYALPRDSEGLHEFCHDKIPNAVDTDGKLTWKNGKAIFTFGKKMGKSLADVVADDPGYLEWMIGGSFSDDLKVIIKNALDGNLPKEPR